MTDGDDRLATTKSIDGDASLSAFIESRFAAGSQDVYSEVTAFVERILITKALQKCSGNLSAAAKSLGITRATLRFKLKRYKVCIETRIEVKAP